MHRRPISYIAVESYPKDRRLLETIGVFRETRKFGKSLRSSESEDGSINRATREGKLDMWDLGSGEEFVRGRCVLFLHLLLVWERMVPDLIQEDIECSGEIGVDKLCVADLGFQYHEEK